MRRTLLILSGVLVLALLAAGLTEAALALGHRNLISDDTSLHSSKPSSSPVSTPSATPTVTPVATPVPTPIPAVTPAVRTATTNSFVHLRAGASTSTAIVKDLNAGTVVVLGTYVDASWQEVTVNGVHGYVYKQWLTY